MILEELKVSIKNLIKMLRDNQTAISIAKNPMHY